MTTSDDLYVPRKDEREPSPAAQPATKKQPYCAFKVSSEARQFLEIRVKFPDPSEAPSYATLTNIQNEWRMGLGFTLIFGTTMIVIVDGENLNELYQAVKECKVEWMAEFNSQDYEPPADDRAPVIKSITIHTTRPETPPPADQRH